MKSKKIICLILALLQILLISSSVLAVEKGERVLLYSKEKLDNIEMNYYGQDIVAYFTVYSKDGVEYPAYCVDYFKGGITDNRSYEVEITESYSNEGVWRAIINGYPFKSASELGCANIQEAYAATKQAVFCMLYDRDLKLYTYKGEAGQRTYEAMKKIVETARNSTQNPTSTQINLREEEWKIDEINNKYLSKEITINCETLFSKFNVKLEGDVPKGTLITDLKNNERKEFNSCNKFKLMVPLENLISESEFTVNVQASVNSYPMYYGKELTSTLQSYVLTAGVIKIEYSSKIIEYPENKTKIIIKKQDKEGNTLKGVKFNILDDNKNIVCCDIKTDDKGIIKLNNMIPGTYYLQEIETMKGYELSNELIEFSVILDEEKEIVVENNRIPEEPENLEPPEESKIPETPTVLEPSKLPRTGW